MSNKETVYEVEIHGNDYDFVEDCWSEDRDTISQNCYDTYEEAANAVRNLTPMSALTLERRSGYNGLDIMIVERTFKGNDESWFIVGEAEWIGASCNGCWV